MFVPFNEMPDHSRIWVYQCNRELLENEIIEIKRLAQKFVNEWTAHQQTLQASSVLFYGIFLVLAVDENHNDASGCSIDKSVHFIRQMETQFNISLLDRFNIAFRRNEKVEVKSLGDFLKMSKDEKLNDSFPIFNNLLTIKADLKTKWEIPLNETWVKMRLDK